MEPVSQLLSPPHRLVSKPENAYEQGGTAVSWLLRFDQGKLRGTAEIWGNRRVTQLWNGAVIQIYYDCTVLA